MLRSHVLSMAEHGTRAQQGSAGSECPDTGPPARRTWWCAPISSCAMYSAAAMGPVSTSRLPSGRRLEHSALAHKVLVLAQCKQCRPPPWQGASCNTQYAHQLLRCLPGGGTWLCKWHPGRSGQVWLVVKHVALGWEAIWEGATQPCIKAATDLALVQTQRQCTCYFASTHHSA